MLTNLIAIRQCVVPPELIRNLGKAAREPGYGRIVADYYTLTYQVFRKTFLGEPRTRITTSVLNELHCKHKIHRIQTALITRRLDSIRASSAWTSASRKTRRRGCNWCHSRRCTARHCGAKQSPRPWQTTRHFNLYCERLANCCSW